MIESFRHTFTVLAFYGLVSSVRIDRGLEGI